MAGIQRRYGTRQQGARALRAADIEAMCKSFSLDLRSVRNKAIILLGFAGGFRRSEIVGAQCQRSRLRRRHAQGYAPPLEDGSESAGGRTIVIMPGENPKTCPVAGVRAWLKAADLEHEGDTSAFRPVSRSGVELTRLCDRTVDRIVKSAVRAAGLKESYSAHSLRAGHVTEALARGADRASIKRQTGHQSDAMIDRYARETNLAANNSSSSLGL